MIKKIFFKRNLYPKFLQELKHIENMRKALVLINRKDESYELIFILNREMTIFKKEIAKDLVKECYLLADSADAVLEIFSLDEIKKIILSLKSYAVMVDSQNIIDYLISNLNNSINYYKFTQEEISDIYRNILKNKDFFEKNPSPIILESENNKWID